MRTTRSRSPWHFLLAPFACSTPPVSGRVTPRPLCQPMSPMRLRRVDSMLRRYSSNRSRVKGGGCSMQYGASGISVLATASLDSRIRALATGYEARADDATLIAGARAAIASIVGATTASAKPPDARIALAVELIRKRPGEAIALRRDCRRGPSFSGSLSPSVHGRDGGRLPAIPPVAAARVLAHRICSRQIPD